MVGILSDALRNPQFFRAPGRPVLDAIRVSSNHRACSACRPAARNEREVLTDFGVKKLQLGVINEFRWVMTYHPPS